MSEGIPTSDPNDESNSDASSLATTLVKRRSYLKYAGTALGGALSTGAVSAADSTGGSDGTQDRSSLNFQPTNLLIEYEQEPNNIEPDDSPPSFSWQIAHAGDGTGQTAYRILVAKSKEALKNRTDLVWDSGKVTSSQMTAIPHAGEPLNANETYYWAVRLWDVHGNASRWSNISSFSTAISPDQWEATWIGREGEDPEPLSLSDSAWIWYPEGNPQEGAPGETRYFRHSFDLEDRSIENARLALLVDGQSEVYLNGESIVEAGGIETATVFNLRSSYQLQAGTNVLAVEVTNEEGPAGLLAHLRIQYENGDQTTFVNTGSEWLASKEASEGWTTQGFDASSWVSARVLGDYGVEPWGKAEMPDLIDVSQSPLLRTDIEIEKPIESARAHVVTLGYGNLYVNGTCLGRTALKPWTEFDDRTLYETHDVTETLSTGTNALGLWLGRGWFSQRIANWASYGVPRGLVQFHITFEDGETRTVTSDSSWRTTQSAVRTNDVYEGETYDARAEHSGWAVPSYDASNWNSADELPSPPNALPKGEDEDWEEQFELRPRRVQPREVMKTLEPESIMEAGDGYIVDFGQNHSGWVELSIGDADAGDEIVIKHAEILNSRDDGEGDPDDVVVDDWEMLPDNEPLDIYTGTIRAADQTDVYIANGSGSEVYEPRFTYHGFRYAKVMGYPGELTADDIRSPVVHTGFERSSSFDISNDDLQQVQENAVWGQRSVSQSLPLDNPQRDERMGWTGDAHMSVRSQLFNFDAYRMFAKYMDDHDDNQSPEGTQTDTIPHGYGSRPADPNWARTRVTIPWFMYQHSGDTRILSERYERMKLYVDYWSDVAENHIIPAKYNHYGDWLAPVEPEINNDLALLNTFAHYQTTDFLAQIADVLGKTEDAQRYRDRARAIADAFNREFFHPDTYSYGSGDMTTYALPLYAGIVPDDHEDEVAEGLVATIWKEYDGKIGTGFVGTRPLVFTLVNHGYIDTAYHMVRQPEEPGWVFMVRNGATTQWERWDAPDYPPDLNSLNHRNWTLISEWFYRVLAGINAAEPGFKRINITPYVVGDLNHAGGEVETVRGTIASRWQRTENGLRLNVSIPSNSTASVSIPTNEMDSVRLSTGDATVWTDGAPAEDLPAGIENVARSGDRIDVEVTPGDYEFTAIRHP